MTQNKPRTPDGRFRSKLKLKLRPDHKGAALALVLMLGALMVAYYFGSPQ